MIVSLLHAPLVAVCLVVASATAPIETPEVEAAQGPRELLAIRADVVHLGDGRAIERGIVLLENGRVRAAGASVEMPPGTPTIEWKGHLAPGFVAAHSVLVQGAEAHDATRGFLPDVYLADAFRPASGWYADALAAGVTTAVLAPTDQNVVGGVTAVVKTATQRIVEPRAHLAISMTNSAVDDRRFPTSFSGLVGELRRLFRAAEGPYGAAVRGQMPVLVAVGDRHQVARAVEFAREFGLRGAFVGAPLAGEQLELLAQSDWPVVFAPPGPGASTRVLESMAAYARSGRPFAFALTDADGLRFGAAQLVRRGIDPGAVLAALTSGGARVANADRRVGRLERGFDGDFVLWDGHPLDLTSRVRAVFVDGRLVHGDPFVSTSTGPWSAARAR